jgi:hypothetical protein
MRGGSLVRAGPPGPAFSLMNQAHRRYVQADEGACPPSIAVRSGLLNVAQPLLAAAPRLVSALRLWFWLRSAYHFVDREFAVNLSRSRLYLVEESAYSQNVVLPPQIGQHFKRLFTPPLGIQSGAYYTTGRKTFPASHQRLVHERLVPAGRTRNKPPSRTFGYRSRPGRTEQPEGTERAARTWAEPVPRRFGAPKEHYGRSIDIE